MEEEKGGIIHIFFIFIGLACLCLGLFIYFTDEKIELKEDPIYIYTDTETDDTEEKDLISEIQINRNEEKTITLKNNKEVKVKYELNDSNVTLFKYNDIVSFEMNESENCSLSYIYNNSLVLYCTYGGTTGHLYTINENGESKKIDTFKDNDNREIIPKSISLNDGTLIVNGSSVLDNSIIKVLDKEINLCNEEEVKSNNITLNSFASASFSLQINNDNPEFVYINTIQTLEDFINDNCKIVE